MGAFQTLGHINFKTRDLKASIKFYETLGFKPFLELTDEDHKPWIVYLRFDDNLYLELTGGGKADHVVHDRGAPKVAQPFLAASIVVTQQLLRAACPTFRWPTRTTTRRLR